jgi:hypothetical protein
VKRKKTELVVEFDEEFVIRRRQPIAAAWCRKCADQVAMLTPDEAAIITGLSSRRIYRCIEAGSLHFSETAEGYLLICQRSLLKVESGDDFDEGLKR